MAALSGVLIDGEPINAWNIVEETDRWFKVELLLDSYLNPRYDNVEHWYFFKA